MDYKFRMSIGDWSDDGHGKHKDYIVLSNHPVERVREAHFRIKEVTGIDIDNLCRRYDDSSIPSEVEDKLLEIGFEFECEGCTYPDEFASLWVFLLWKADPGLELKIVNDNIPTLHFYGFDEKRRHIGHIGYGLFY